jgi:hypothetical protein
LPRHRRRPLPRLPPSLPALKPPDILPCSANNSHRRRSGRARARPPSPSFPSTSDQPGSPLRVAASSARPKADVAGSLLGPTPSPALLPGRAALGHAVCTASPVGHQCAPSVQATAPWPPASLLSCARPAPPHLRHASFRRFSRFSVVAPLPMARPLAPACLRPNGTVDPMALLGAAALLSGQLRSATPVSTSVPYGAPSSSSFGLTTPALTPFPAALQPYVTAPCTSYGIPPPLVPLAPPSFGVGVVRVLLHDGQLI